jgi:hypothetical protein
MSQAADLMPLAKCNCIDDDEGNSLLLDTQYERALQKIDQAAVPNSVVYGEIIGKFSLSPTQRHKWIRQESVVLTLGGKGQLRTVTSVFLFLKL